MKRFIAFLVVLSVLAAQMSFVNAASNEAVSAANELYDLGLFQGVGTNADGTPNYDLDRAPSRAEGVTMLVRLLGKEKEAQSGNWQTPFTDVVEWAKPYVGYAYANNLTNGVSTTQFDCNSTISATQYLTFVLRALGYSSESDFLWNKAWELSDKLRITNGQYNNDSSFMRADVALISKNALSAQIKGKDTTLLSVLGLEAPDAPPSQASPSSPEPINTELIIPRPSYLLATSGDQGIAVSWEGLSSTEASGYILCQSEEKYGTYHEISRIDNVSVTAYLVTNITPGIQYFFRVQAYKEVNGQIYYSDFTIPDSALAPTTTGFFLELPALPQTLNYSLISGNTVKITDIQWSVSQEGQGMRLSFYISGQLLTRLNGADTRFAGRWNLIERDTGKVVGSSYLYTGNSNLQPGETFVSRHDSGGYAFSNHLNNVPHILEIYSY